MMAHNAANDLEMDIDVTTMNEEKFLSDFKTSISKKSVEERGEEQEQEEEEEEEEDEKDDEKVSDHVFDECRDDEYETSANTPSKSKKNIQIWKQPEIRDIVIDFINRDISSRAAASKISEMLGRSVSHSTVLMYANRILRGDRRPVVSQSLPANGNSTACKNVRFEVVKTSRGTENGLAVFEDNNNFVRLYRRTSHTDKSSFYRCSTCDHLYEKYGGGERPSVKMKENYLCGNAFPLHNPLCPATPVEQFRRAQHDLEARQLDSCRRTMNNMARFKLLGRSAENDLADELDRTDEKSLSDQKIFPLNSDDGSKEGDQLQFDQLDDEKENIIKNFLDTYKIDEVASLIDLSKMIRENTGIEISTMSLWKYFKKYPNESRILDAKDEEFGNYEIMEGGSRQVLVKPTLSKYLNETIITVPEDGGFRQYSFMKKSANEVRSYYRCLGCARAKRIYGSDRFAYIKVQFGEVIDKPLHHHRCEPMAEENIVVQNLDRECRKSIRTGEKNPKEAHAEGMEKAAELSAMVDGSSDRYENIPTLFPTWHNVKNAYYRHKDSSKKGSFAREFVTNEDLIDIDEYHIGPPYANADIARFEEIEQESFVNRSESYGMSGEGTFELSPEMLALKHEVLYDMQHIIKREVSKAVNAMSVELERRFEEKMMQILDVILQQQDGPLEILETDEDNFDSFSTEAVTVVGGPSRKRRRVESCKRENIAGDAPFAIPEHYLNRRSRPPTTIEK